MEPAFTLIGGILRFETMASLARRHLKAEVNVPRGDMVQFTTALGAAILARQRLSKLSGQNFLGAPALSVQAPDGSRV